MTKRKPVRRKRSKVGTVDGMPMNPKLTKAFQAAGVLPAPVTVNRVTCDGNAPGGFRVDSIPVQPGEEV